MTPFQSHSYTLIDCEQKKDKTLLKQAQTHSYFLKKFHGGGTTVGLLCFKDKIVIPTSLTKQIIQWYHYLVYVIPAFIEQKKQLVNISIGLR
jgi:hypothetical protein